MVRFLNTQVTWRSLAANNMEAMQTPVQVTENKVLFRFSFLANGVKVVPLEFP